MTTKMQHYTVVGIYSGDWPAEVFADQVMASDTWQALHQVAKERGHRDVVLIGVYAGHGAFSAAGEECNTASSEAVLEKAEEED